MLQNSIKPPQHMWHQYHVPILSQCLQWLVKQPNYHSASTKKLLECPHVSVDVHEVLSQMLFAHIAVSYTGIPGYLGPYDGPCSSRPVCKCQTASAFTAAAWGGHLDFRWAGACLRTVTVLAAFACWFMSTSS